MKWLNSIGLHDFSPNLKESGVHGAVIALDSNFRAEEMAIHLKLPNNHQVNPFEKSVIFAFLN